MPMKCNLVERVSKEGKPYRCLEIYITDTYKKTVFLLPSEIALIELQSTKVSR